VLFEGFPSPCGEKVGINGSAHLNSVKATTRVVSVPLRGKGRDQPGGSQSPQSGVPTEVSVPLRGKGRDQQYFPAD